MTNKEGVQQILGRVGVTDLHGAVYVLTKGLSEPLPDFIEHALMDIFDIPREAIIFAAGDLLLEIYQPSLADIESALKVSNEGA